MSRWTEFHQRHRRQGFAPAFNGFLDAQILDADEAIKMRVCAWLLRRSWGNWSDSCVDGENIIQTQADCARDLGLDRRAVNPAFRALERGNYIRSEGREIFVIDDPRGMFDGLSPSDGPLPEPERNGVTCFQYFTEHIWGAANPEKFQRLQEIEREHQQIRTEILSQFKTHQRKALAADSGSSDPIGQSRPQGPDTGGETGRQAGGDGPTMGAAVLITGTKNYRTPSIPTPKSNGNGRQRAGENGLPIGEEEPAGWGRFCELAEQAGMHLGRSEYERRKAEFAALPLADQIAACHGIEERLACGQYDPVNRPSKTPFLRNYLFDRKWEDPLRAPEKSAPDTSVLDLLDQGVPEEEALKIIEERNGKRKTGPLVRHAGEGGEYAG